MSYSCSDFTDDILNALKIDVSDDDADNPSAQADLAMKEIERLQSAALIPLAPAPATLTVWTCTTDGDNMGIETVTGVSFEEVAEPCRESLREMEWDDRHGTPLDTADQISDAWEETFDGVCIIKSHEIALPVAPASPPAAPSLEQSCDPHVEAVAAFV